MNTTSDISKFRARERHILIKLLQAWNDHGLPENFWDNKVQPTMDINSGHVFLTNSDFQICMLNDENLEIWYNCPICGHEGFLEDMPHNKDNTECQEYLAKIL